MRRFGKVDQNQREVIDMFRASGAVVHSLASLGGGVPDLLVGYRGLTHLIEVKNPHRTDKDAAAPRQAAWRARWRGTPVLVVRTLEDVQAALSLWNSMPWARW